MKKKAWFVGALAASIWMTGCLEPSRESQRDTAADARCGRLEECGNLGSDGAYSDFEDCVVSVRADFNDFWPADECSDGRINEARYDECLETLRTQDCNPNFFEQLAEGAEFVNDCNADAICIDPPN